MIPIQLIKNIRGEISPFCPNLLWAHIHMLKNYLKKTIIILYLKKIKYGKQKMLIYVHVELFSYSMRISCSFPNTLESCMI